MYPIPIIRVAYEKFWTKDSTVIFGSEVTPDGVSEATSYEGRIILVIDIDIDIELIFS